MNSKFCEECPLNELDFPDNMFSVINFIHPDNLAEAAMDLINTEGLDEQSAAEEVAKECLMLTSSVAISGVSRCLSAVMHGRCPNFESRLEFTERMDYAVGNIAADKELGSEVLEALHEGSVIDTYEAVENLRDEISEIIMRMRERDRQLGNSDEVRKWDEALESLKDSNRNEILTYAKKLLKIF